MNAATPAQTHNAAPSGTSHWWGTSDASTATVIIIFIDIAMGVALFFGGLVPLTAGSVGEKKQELVEMEEEED
ncbi:hypothetical protein HO133_005854 [Letharia lupina]|uniref:Uncharacterized protein n=1 Tax=Letharia lupina TaxID=560253 RepID=A0A8H6C7P9_9LECA|nr:uncharacterized protein HO133_005854 [Letharia lupina]KAF6218505.1 hypothetical protein HO133_005854 [Letharia lupina]